MRTPRLRRHVVAATLLLAAALPARAQVTGFALKLLKTGIKLAVMAALEDEPNYATRADLNRILDTQLNAFRVQEVDEAYLGLVGLVHEYDPAKENLSRSSDVQAIVNAAEDLRTKTNDLIAGSGQGGSASFVPANFWNLLPTHLLVTAVQVSFLEESIRVAKEDGQADTSNIESRIAAVALQELQRLKKGFTYFRLPEGWDCVTASSRNDLWTPSGHHPPASISPGNRVCRDDWKNYSKDSKHFDFRRYNLAETNHTDSEFHASAKGVRERVCKKYFYVNPIYFHRDQGPFIAGGGKYQYVARFTYPSGESEHWVSEQFSSRADADRSRARQALNHHGEELGDVKAVMQQLIAKVQRYAGSRTPASVSAAEAIGKWFGVHIPAPTAPTASTSAAPTTASSGPRKGENLGTRLVPGMELRPGDWVESDPGFYRFTMNPDGVLGSYRIHNRVTGVTFTAAWTGPSATKGATHARVEPGKGLVVYKGQQPLWTLGGPGKDHFLDVGTTGNVCVIGDPGQFACVMKDTAKLR